MNVSNFSRPTIELEMLEASSSPQSRQIIPTTQR
jgi:hypothetical protein